jgi:hypothetical protein
MSGSLVERIEVADVSVEDLLEAGFSTEEVGHLIELKAEYPYLEYVDSGRQWQRMLFLKWRYENGDLRR